MFSLTAEQILVIVVLSVWFLFPLGILVSFIKQSNEAHVPKVKNQPLANDIAHSKAYAPEVDEDNYENNYEEFEPKSIPAYQIPGNKNSNDYHPRV